MTVSSLITGQPTCFQLKTSFAPCTILQITSDDLGGLEHQLAETIKRAPNFFHGSPIVIDLEKIKTTDTFDFAKLKQILLAAAMVPIGTHGGTEAQQEDAFLHGLPTLVIGKLSNVDIKKKAAERVSNATRIITTPIRSGMQIYAKGGDLVVIAPVSAGAELLADGNIHVYGPLRGRAMAGVQGNTQARIFCHALEAELVSIAGYYLIKEDIHTLPEAKNMIQIYLDNEQVRIDAI